MRLTLKQIIVLASRGVYKNKKFVILFWLTNFLFSVALTLPIFAMLQDSLSNSTLSSKIYWGFDTLWFIQFLSIYEKSLSVVPYTIYSVIGIYIIIQLFYLGGLLSVLINSQKNHFVDFFFGAVKYFSRFIKIAFFTFIFYFIALGINIVLDYMVRVFFLDSGSTLWEFVIQLIRYLFFLLLIGVVSIISDYSKIALALNDSTKTLKTIFRTILFIKENFGRVITVFLILFCFLAIGGIVYNLVDGLVPRSPIYWIVLNFIIQQLLIIFRVVIRMLVYSAGVVLYNDLSAEIIYSKAEEIKFGE
ncbi:MAG TPA: hypothetical protein PK397_05800 [Ignavibacteriaceae bacterium]|nr:hypothetical protein [Ignavibacteriaceae bacterium]